ncbi:MAG: type VI secretion system baseplate subunit TssG [Tannerella sp.]|jgi:hypothetical protein|nr:type VI secretion system baseplate subunit TssG [Tannerella sp.]
MEKTGYGKILNFESLGNQPNVEDSDYRAEIVAASLIEKGYDPNKIIITRQGAEKRGFGKDIETISLFYSEYDQTDFLQIKSNREGIYDILPEGIFHQTVNRKFNQDKEEMIDEIKIHREEEFYARKFFRLFEIELDNLLTDIALIEVEFDKRISHPNYVKIFSSFWPVMEWFEREQAVLFLHTIPILHRIRNRFSAINESLTLILGVPVHIRPVIMKKKESKSVFESELGVSRLGINVILGNTFDDGQYDMIVRIGPMSALKMKDFLKGAKNDRILDSLCQLFLPANVFIAKEYELEPEDSVFVFSTDQTATWLGINSYL